MSQATVTTTSEVRRWFGASYEGNHARLSSCSPWVHTIHGRFGSAFVGPMKNIPFRGRASYAIFRENSVSALYARPSLIRSLCESYSNSRDRPSWSVTFRMWRSSPSRSMSRNPSFNGLRRRVAVPPISPASSSNTMSSRMWRRWNVRSRGKCSGAASSAKTLSNAPIVYALQKRNDSMRSPPP